MTKSSQLKKRAKTHLDVYWGESVAIFSVFASFIVMSVLIGYISTEILFRNGLAENRYPAIFFENNGYFLILLAVRLLLLYIITAPAYFGRCWCYLQAAKGQSAPANCLFSCYSTKGVFLRSLKLKLMVDLKKFFVLIPALTAVVFEYSLLKSMYHNGINRLLMVIFIICGIILVISLICIYSVLTMKYLLVQYLFVSNPDEDASVTIKKSSEMMHGHETSMLFICISFLGWFALCVILFPLFSVVPYFHMTIAEAVNDILSGSKADIPAAVKNKKRKGKNLVRT